MVVESFKLVLDCFKLASQPSTIHVNLHAMLMYSYRFYYRLKLVFYLCQNSNIMINGLVYKQKRVYLLSLMGKLYLPLES